MSFLKELKNKRNKLRSTQTLITYPDGKRFLVSKEQVEVAPQTCGFVIDLKPDNIPARITENIYLGSQDCCEPQVLSEYQISRVLSVGIQPPCFVSNVEYKFVECLDLPESDLKSVVEECVPFIKESLGRILVHCNAGVSRSASVVIGFLIFERDFDYARAHSLVKNARNCIKPNSGFVKQLMLFR